MQRILVGYNVLQTNKKNRKQSRAIEKLFHSLYCCFIHILFPFCHDFVFVRFGRIFRFFIRSLHQIISIGAIVGNRLRKMQHLANKPRVFNANVMSSECKQCESEQTEWIPTKYSLKQIWCALTVQIHSALQRRWKRCRTVSKSKSIAEKKRKKPLPPTKWQKKCLKLIEQMHRQIEADRNANCFQPQKLKARSQHQRHHRHKLPARQFGTKIENMLRHIVHIIFILLQKFGPDHFLPRRTYIESTQTEYKVKTGTKRGRFWKKFSMLQIYSIALKSLTPYKCIPAHTSISGHTSISHADNSTIPND